MFSVNYRDPLPIYEQIKLNLQHMMLSGSFSQDSKLPSVRELASQLAINPNTIQRAYRELEAEGLIVTIQGKGSYPADISVLQSKIHSRLYVELDNVVTKLYDSGISQNELISHIYALDKGGERL